MKKGKMTKAEALGTRDARRRTLYNLDQAEQRAPERQGGERRDPKSLNQCAVSDHSGGHELPSELERNVEAVGVEPTGRTFLGHPGESATPASRASYSDRFRCLYGGTETDRLMEQQRLLSRNFTFSPKGCGVISTVSFLVAPDAQYVRLGNRNPPRPRGFRNSWHDSHQAPASALGNDGMTPSR